MKNDLISVIINIYNCEKYLNKCIDSVINQTYKNIEILLINDGSTDNTLKICKSYKDKRIKIITTENMGLSQSRNVGIDNAKGNYLYFIDADDFIEKDTIEYLYKLIKDNKADVSTCQTLDIYNYDFKYHNKKEIVEVLKGEDYLKKILLSLDRCTTTWNKLIKKDLFDNLRFEKRIINDMALMYKIALRCHKFIFSNQVKYFYLKNPNSITGKHKADRAIDQYLVGIDRYNYVENIIPNLKENKIGLLHSIVMVYNHNNEKVDLFLKENNAKTLFNKNFSFNIVLFSKLKNKQKIKIILYRINPKLERFIQSIIKK